MPKLLSFPVEGGSVMIAVRTPDDDVTPVGVLEDTVEKVNIALDESFEIIAGVAHTFQKSMKHVGKAVKEAELEFGVQFTTKGSIYIVEAEGQASFKVKLTFEPSERQPTTP